MANYDLPCEVCSSSLLVRLFDKDSYQYENCSNCGLIRIQPQPTDEALDAIYQNDYYAVWGKNESAFRALKRKTFTNILRMLPSESRGGKLLDVGAATGLLMELAEEWGYKSYGVEVSQDGAAAIMKRFGSEYVFSGYFDQIDFAKTGMLGTFDVVSMIDLLEHVRNPNESLIRVYALLKPKGNLLLCLPDASSLSAHILGKRWNHYAPEHLFSFSKKSLSMLLQKHGFTVCKLEPAPKYMTVEYFYSYLLRYPGGVGFLRPFLARVPSAFRHIPVSLHTGQMQVWAVKE